MSIHKHSKITLKIQLYHTDQVHFPCNFTAWASLASRNTSRVRSTRHQDETSTTCARNRKRLLRASRLVVTVRNGRVVFVSFPLKRMMAGHVSAPLAPMTDTRRSGAEAVGRHRRRNPSRRGAPNGRPKLRFFLSAARGPTGRAQ